MSAGLIFALSGNNIYTVNNYSIEGKKRREFASCEVLLMRMAYVRRKGGVYYEMPAAAVSNGKGFVIYCLISRDMYTTTPMIFALSLTGIGGIPCAAGTRKPKPSPGTNRYIEADPCTSA